MSYDPSNIFAKILRAEIPCKKVYEDEYVLAFDDINPKAPTHILVIPKGPYIDCQDFVSSADDAEVNGFYRAVGKIIAQSGIGATGYRLVSNAGVNGHQEVPHYHVHILGGHDLGAMI